MIIVSSYDGYDSHQKRIDLHERTESYRMWGKFFDSEDLESELHASGYSDYEIAQLFINNDINAFRTGQGNQIIAYVKEVIV